MMSMANLVVIGVETPKIDSGCSLEKEFTKLICINPNYQIDPYESKDIMPNYQSGLFMSRLCTWSFDLRHQRHLMDG